MSAVIVHDTFQTLVRNLREIPEPDRADEWPATQLKLLAAAGGLQWNIPTSYGGVGADSIEMLDIYRALAAGSLLTNVHSDSTQTPPVSVLKLRPTVDSPTNCFRHCVEESCLQTVGISHLTTSRQHLQTPAVTVTEQPDDQCFLLNGSVPWATAAPQADLIVTGGTLSDGRQILAAVPDSSKKASRCSQPFR